jgi:HTH-type transcriptional regulator / antitoxin HigA
MNIKTKHRRMTELPKAFDALVRLMPPMAIRDDVQHSNTVEIVDRLMQIERLSRGQSDYLETLVELVESYEAKRHVLDIAGLTGAAMLRHVVEQSGISGSDLARLLGMHATMGSKILNGERRLTWKHAKILASRFKVAPALFMD